MGSVPALNFAVHGKHLVSSDSHRGVQPLRRTGHWRVIHACDHAREILPLVEGQVAAGMRPYLVTLQGSGAAELYLGKNDLGQPGTLSLLRAWQDVRNWRKSLLECDPENTSDVVHAHSFAAGMAAVRNLSCVVYDINACIEEIAISAGQCEPGSWMGRSFRVAEQFVLSRAQTVIVHSSAMKAAVEERGAAPENVFLIPPPLSPNGDDPPPLGNNFLPERFGLAPTDVIYFVSDTGSSSARDLSPSLMSVLEAFVLVLAELSTSLLIIESSPEKLRMIRSHAERLGIAEHLLIVQPDDARSIMQNATVVVATGETPEDPVKMRQPNEGCLRAMNMNKPLLAADVPRNRDNSPEGRGCLWFTDGDIRDLGYRMAFLGSNPEFCATLAASGYAYVHETRSVTAIGHLYDAAYRHAISRKKVGGPGQQALNLLPLAC